MVRVCPQTAVFTIALAISFLVLPRLSAAASTVKLNPPSTPVAVGQATLIYTRHLSVPRVSAPGSFVMTDTVQNTGTASAINVVVRQDLPRGMTTDGSATVRLQFGTVGAGTTVSKTTTVTVSAATVVGRYANEATLSADGIDSILGEVMLDVTKPSVLGAETSLAETGASVIPWVATGVVMMGLGFFLRRTA